MPDVPTVAPVFQRPSTFLEIVPSPDVKSLLTDALLSFSPLATLVGIDAVRSLAHRSTSFKQCVAMSIAPIGTLGVMATICKASNLSWLKVMLGVRDQNIYDAGREVGCGVAIGSALPRMDQFGDLISDVKEEDYNQAAHAIVRFEWRTGFEQRHLDFDTFRWIAENFAGATVSGRVRWKMRSEDALEAVVSRVQGILWRSSHGFAIDAFEAIHRLNGGQGIIELSWPAPAMPLETQPQIVVLLLFLNLVLFLLVLVFLDPPHCALRASGFALLVIGHWSTRFAVETQRLTLPVAIPKMQSGKAWNTWMLVDKPKFPTILARRSFFPTPSGLFKNFCSIYASSRNPRITLGQHHQFKRLHTNPILTILALTVLCAGLVTFYLGIKSSNLHFVILLVVSYIMANVSKGTIALSANASYLTSLNCPGHPRVDKPYSADQEVDFVGEEQESQRHAGEDVDGIELGATLRRDANPEKAPPGSSAVEAASSFPDALTIYCKFQARDRKGIDLFCFSSPHEWIIAARIIIRTIKPFLASGRGLPPITHPQSLLRVPIYTWRSRVPEGSHGQCLGLLLMAIENIKPDELFWSVGMEISMILLGNYQSPRLCSEQEDAMNRSLLGSVVYTCTRILLSEFARSDNVQSNTKQLGVKSLMHSVEAVANGHINPRQDIPSIIPTLRAAASAAITASGARPIAQARRAPLDEVLEESYAESDEFTQLVKLRSKKLKDLDKLLDKLMAYIDVMANERWAGLPPFKPCWTEDLKACENFRHLASDAHRVPHQQSQTGRFVPPSELEEQEPTFALPGLPQLRATFNSLLLQELRCLELYQNSGFLPHHSKFLTPAQRAWLDELLVFQLAIQPPSASTSHQPAAPIIDSHFDEHSRQLWRLYRLPRLQQLQYLQELQGFLRFLKWDSQDTYSPFQKQVDITLECAEQVTAYFAQRPFKPWAAIGLGLTSQPPRLLWPVFGASLSAFITSSVMMPLTLVSLIFKLIVSVVIAFVFFVCLLAVVAFFIDVGFVNPSLAYAMSCKIWRSHEEHGRRQSQEVILTEGQVMRSLIGELELLRVETMKRRAPLLVALLEERGEDWDQIEAEPEQENDGHPSL